MPAIPREEKEEEEEKKGQEWIRRRKRGWNVDAEVKEMKTAQREKARCQRGREKERRRRRREGKYEFCAHPGSVFVGSLLSEKPTASTAPSPSSHLSSSPSTSMLSSSAEGRERTDTS